VEYLEGKKSKNITKHGDAGAAAGLHHPIMEGINLLQAILWESHYNLTRKYGLLSGFG